MLGKGEGNNSRKKACNHVFHLHFVLRTTFEYQKKSRSPITMFGAKVNPNAIPNYSGHSIENCSPLQDHSSVILTSLK